jgi:hypothetical protein
LPRGRIPPQEKSSRGTSAGSLGATSKFLTLRPALGRPKTHRLLRDLYSRTHWLLSATCLLLTRDKRWSLKAALDGLWFIVTSGKVMMRNVRNKNATGASRRRSRSTWRATCVGSVREYDALSAMDRASKQEKRCDSHTSTSHLGALPPRISAGRGRCGRALGKGAALSAGRPAEGPARCGKADRCL